MYEKSDENKQMYMQSFYPFFNIFREYERGTRFDRGGKLPG